MRIILLLPLLVLSHFLDAQPLHFSPSEEVASTTLYGGLRPRIAMLHDTIPLVVFGKGGADPAVFFTPRTSTGFSTPIRINGAHTGAIVGTSNGPEIKCKGDTVYIVYSSYSSGTPTVASVVLWRSFNGGLSFSDSTLVAQSNTDMFEFADITVTENNQPIIACIQADPAMINTSIAAWYSSDHGASFSASTGISGLIMGQPCECCPISLENAGNKVYVGFRNNISNLREFYVAGSSNGGVHFSQSWQIDHSGWIVNSCPVNGIDLLHTGDSLHAAFSTMAGTTLKTKHSSIMEGATSGSGQSPEVFAEPAPPNQNMVNASIAGNSDTLFIAWQDNRSTNTDVHVSWRISGSGGFQQPLTANDSLAGGQRNPDLQWSKSTLNLIYNDVSNNKVVYRKASFMPFLGQELEEENSLLLYPNPTKESLWIKDSKELINKVLIYNSMGQLMLFSDVNYSHEINISCRGLSAGVFFLAIEFKSGRITRNKIVIEK